MKQPVKSGVNYESYISNEAKNILDKIPEVLATEFGQFPTDLQSFLYVALSEPDCLLYKAVNGFINSYELRNLQEIYYGKLKDKAINAAVLPLKGYTPEFKNLLIGANAERQKMGQKFITSDHILLASLANGEAKEFIERGLDYKRMVTLSQKIHKITDALSTIPLEMPESSQIILTFDPAMPGTDHTALTTIMGNTYSSLKNKHSKTSSVPFCTNMNGLPQHKICGRSDELNKIIKVLGRKNRNNVVLVGDSGVGKTSIVEGLVNLIMSEDCPPLLENCIVYRFNSYELLAGTQLRGQFEERINAMISAFKKNPRFIFFVDDFHNIVNEKHKDEYDFVGGLSEMIKGGSIKVIATTTFSGYKSGFEETDLSKSFQKITVDKPTKQECHDIIYNSKEEYEQYHNVRYTDEALETALVLSERYITEKTQPSSTLGIIDEAASLKKMSLLRPSTITVYLEKIKNLENEKEKYLKADNIVEVNNITNIISGIKILINDIETEIKEREFLGYVDEEDVRRAVSEHTGIQMDKLSTDVRKTIANIGNVLKANVIGQDESMDEIAHAIKRNKVGLFPIGRPEGSFMMIGDSGCGKTLTAKTLAKEIYGDEKYLVCFDMSEYSDKTAVNKLIGASAGYVGYSKGGLLTEAVKSRKYCVLLIDEIEKADDEVYNLFLQVLDEGHLTDNMGYKVDFKNTIIIFTSNIGTKEASNTKGLGFNVNENLNKKDIISKELKKKFPPEFINRLDGVLYFNTLNDDNLKEIIKIEIGKLKKRINGIGYDIEYTDDVVDFIFGIVNEERKYGARPIIRCIQNNIENRIADLLLENDYEKDKVFAISVKEKDIFIT